MRCFPHCLLLRTSIIQCATNGFCLFLPRWNPLIKVYSIEYFNFYHKVRRVRVLEDFNCILLGGWTLILGIGLGRPVGRAARTGLASPNTDSKSG